MLTQSSRNADDCDRCNERRVKYLDKMAMLGGLALSSSIRPCSEIVFTCQFAGGRFFGMLFIPPPSSPSSAHRPIPSIYARRFGFFVAFFFEWIFFFLFFFFSSCLHYGKAAMKHNTMHIQYSNAHTRRWINRLAMCAYLYE